MKKGLKLAAMALVGVMAFASCQKENNVFHAYMGGNNTKLHIYADGNRYYPCWDNGGTNVVSINGVQENVTLETDHHVTFPCPQSQVTATDFFMFTLGSSAGTLVSGTNNQYSFTMPSSFDYSTTAFTAANPQILNIPMGGYSNENNGDINFKTDMAIINFRFNAHSQGVPFTITSITLSNDNVDISGNFIATINASENAPISTAAGDNSTNTQSKQIYISFGSNNTINYGTNFYDVYVAVPTNLTTAHIHCGAKNENANSGVHDRDLNFSGKLHPGKVLVLNMNKIIDKKTQM